MISSGTGGASAVSPLLGAGTSATTGALSGLAGYSPTSFAGVLSDASAAANDPSVDARIRAATRDAERSVYEGALPQLDRSAALNGNLMSSRSGVSEGIIKRGLADTVADTSANIRGDAYKTGLEAALTRANSGDTSRLGALSTLLSGGNAAVGTGTDALTGLYGLAGGGVTGQQAGSQAAIDDALARYQFGISSPFDALNQYFSLIGAKNWGGTTTESGTTTKTTQESPYTTAGKLLTAAGSFSPYKTK